MLSVGCRVVRGPDWVWGEQDGGEGHCGTLFQVGRPGSKQSPDKTVVVIWDTGRETNYRVGYNNAYDLRLLDNAPAGVKHPNIICDSCKRSQGIVGMRFKCCSCFDFDLCFHCYMSDKHDLNHIFQRFDTPHSVGVELTARKGSTKLNYYGTFIGAKVVRGSHWEWNDQDGGEGKTGRVLDVRGWDNETGRSVVNVTWTSGFSNIYRMGHKGRVDLTCVEPALGGTYYCDHLPVLGRDMEVYENRGEGVSSHLTFSVGDKVKVVVDVDTLRRLQEGHGGWNPRMVECVGATGQVHRVTDRGDIRVCYDGNMRWTLNPAALAKLHSFSVNDVVMVDYDVIRVKHLQKGHGEWIDPMVSILGKLGKVTKIYSDGDLRVTVDGQTWTLNPLSVQLWAGSTAELENIMESHPSSTAQDADSTRASMLGALMETQLELSETMTTQKLVRAAALGDLELVREHLILHPNNVDSKSGNKTCLHVASHEGHVSLVKWLLSVGASLSEADNEGDTALHYAAFGNKSDVMELLLERGADVNAVNKSLCSALHVSVSKGHIECVRILLRADCDVNLQDQMGDTCLHDAIGNEFDEAVDLLLVQTTPGVDLTLKNKRGFNALHHAVLKGNTAATVKLIDRARQLVDVKKDDGFAALHLACLNGHRAVADALLTVGLATIDIVNNKRQTPLMLAVSQGHAAVVELLVKCGADLTLVDEDGDTPLHMTLIKRASVSMTHVNRHEAPSIYTIWLEIGGSSVDNSVAVAIACYLVQEGCPLDTKNNKEKTPLDLVASTHIPNLLKRYVGQPKEKKSERRPVECSVCSELSDGNTILEPCGHRVACEDCTSRLKKCLKCSRMIARRLTPDGRTVPYKSRQPSAECLRYLETKIAEIEEAHCCSICMERRKNVAFLCGHGACDKCSATLRTCHMCRKTITTKINLY